MWFTYHFGKYTKVQEHSEAIHYFVTDNAKWFNHYREDCGNIFHNDRLHNHILTMYPSEMAEYVQNDV